MQGSSVPNPRRDAKRGQFAALGSIAGPAIMESMFFRREHIKDPTFAERLENLRGAGFTIAPMAGGVVRASRGGCAVDLRDDNGSVVIAGRAGVALGSEIGALVDGGFQKFFVAPSGAKKPALADDLTALHDFEEDLKQGLGQESYYNQSLGTVSTFYRYDRVKDRDRGVPKRVWE
jgi:hypothetical protein